MYVDSLTLYDSDALWVSANAVFRDSCCRRTAQVTKLFQNCSSFCRYGRCHLNTGYFAATLLRCPKSPRYLKKKPQAANFAPCGEVLPSQVLSFDNSFCQVNFHLPRIASLDKRSGVYLEAEGLVSMRFRVLWVGWAGVARRKRRGRGSYTWSSPVWGGKDWLFPPSCFPTRSTNPFHLSLQHSISRVPGHLSADVAARYIYRMSPF